MSTERCWLILWILAMIAGGEAGYLDGKVLLAVGLDAPVGMLGPFGVVLITGVLLISWRLDR